MNIFNRWLGRTVGWQDVILSNMLMVAIFMMVLPLPTLLVDALIAINLTLSIILLMIAIYVREPLEFSVFPSLLLITTLYRLALTISTSRLILLQHDAGEIVYTFGNFVVGGNLAVGITIFSIITIVQFIVITKGSERVAEVSARFSLDGMPGKQMSIDGDMRAGTIDAAEATRLRALVQKESQMYGAMDGAMKFVKGDAIASIIVILVNILGGMAVGVMQHHMSVSEALSTYAVLSIGDGLVAQIPALLISITAGIIVTRVPGEKRQNLAAELTQQVSRQPASLIMAGAVLAVFALIPGFPVLIFGGLAALILAGTYFYHRKGGGAAQSSRQLASSGGKETMSPGAVPLKLCVSPEFKKTDLDEALQTLRWQLFEKLGVPLPDIHVQSSQWLGQEACQILIYQEVVLQIQLKEEEVLLATPMPQLPCRVEALPFGGEELYWLESQNAEQAQAAGVSYYEGHQRVVFLMEKVLERYAKEFIGVQETRYLMDAMEERYAELVKELQRQLPVGKIADILQRLVEEGISIRDLRSIFEAMVEWVPKEKDSIMLTEYARIALRRHIQQRFKGEQPWICALMIGEGIENLIRESIRQTAAGSYCALEPESTQRILAKIKQSLPVQGRTVLLTSIDVRRFLRKIIERELFTTAVLSFQELGDDAELKVLGHIDVVGEELDAITR